MLLRLGSTPFPYTTLFRSGPALLEALRDPLDLDVIDGVADLDRRRAAHAVRDVAEHRVGAVEVGLWRERDERSEEHTSELQSQSNLVCRLLRARKGRPRHL